MLTEKDSLRIELLNKRRSLSENIRKRYSAEIVEKIKNLPEFKEANTIMLYCATKGEPDLTPLFKEVISLGKVLLLPRVKGNEIEAVITENPSCLSKGTFGILEPSEGSVISPREIDFVAVPGIAFDKRGYRIGFGKGYYDRFLKHVKGIKVGIAYSFQIVEELPHDPWDVPVDLIITESSVRRLR